jgi:hypothetical protein
MHKRVEEFDYLNSNLSQSFAKDIAPRAGEMFEQEVRERARLLYNLKYSVAEAIARIRNNIEWEFDQSWNKQDPAILQQVDKIVKAFYKTMKGKLD